MRVKIYRIDAQTGARRFVRKAELCQVMLDRDLEKMGAQLKLYGKGVMFDRTAPALFIFEEAPAARSDEIGLRAA